jgi:serine/threonine protein kinase
LQRIVQNYGLTQNPSNGNYMLVMEKASTDLRKHLQQTHNQLTWKEKIKIIYDIILALVTVHNVKAIHRNLHSGNILYSKIDQYWSIGDLGFCGPANKPSTSIYGNLPYIAPEVISGKNATKASDIYSVAMLMWEVSSGQPPFSNYEHNYYLATNIINGMRPKIVSGIPLKYEELMKQCWNADPSKRPNIDLFWKKLKELSQNISNESFQLETGDDLGISDSITSSKLFTGKIHQFGYLPEPRNATEGIVIFLLVIYSFKINKIG